MRLRTLIGFGIGYALGAKSDPKKFEELQQMYQSLSQSPIFKAVLEQAKQSAATGMETLTGQQPPWAQSQAGNGQQAQQAQGQQAQGQQAEVSESSESSQQSEGSSEGGNGDQQSSDKQQASQSSGKQQKQSGSKS